jgi:hypothetical protein
MNQSQLLGLLRRYVKESWSREQRIVRDTPEYFARKAEYDGALKALALLELMSYELRNREQPTLGGEG